MDIQSEGPERESESETPKDDESTEAPDSAEDDDSTEYSIEDLLVLAQDAFNRADAALRTGDLAGYQRWVETASGYIAKAQELLSQSSSQDDADAA